jgi:MerR family transcriptional regulator, mercuric resistance operon regulatory protein
MRIGELARRTATSADTLRFYERRGVLARPRRASNGYRDYAESAVERVHLVRRALAVGFTLRELERILRQRDEGGVPCREARALLARKLAEVQRRRRELAALDRLLAALLSDWDTRLAATPAGRPARLLERLAEAHPGHLEHPRKEKR